MYPRANADTYALCPDADPGTTLRAGGRRRVDHRLSRPMAINR